MTLHEDLFRAAFDVAPVGMALLDLDGLVAAVNQTACELVGSTEAGIVGTSLLDLADGDHVAEDTRQIARCIDGTQRVFTGQRPIRNRATGEEIWVDVHLSVLRDDDGAPAYLVVHIVDVTERRAAIIETARVMHHQATHDQLTGLPNRGALTDRLAELVATCGADEEVAVLYVDIDRFKVINDTRGHAAGDALLVEVADRLRADVRRSDMVARLGGDEFVVVAVVTGAAGAYQLAEATCRGFATPFLVDGEPMAATASVGLATTGRTGDGISLLQAADLALYEAKAAGRNCWVAYLPGVTTQPELLRAGTWSDPGTVDPCSLDGARIRATASSQLDQLMAHLPAQIPTALANEQLVVGYHPTDVVDGRTRKVEARVRWEHPTLGLLLPGAFLAAMERSPHQSALTGEILRQACHQVAEWRGEGATELEVSVTVSRRELLDGRIVERVRRALIASGLPAGALWIETTGTTTSLDHPRIRRTTERLCALGVRIAFDDPATAEADDAPSWAPVLQAASA